MVGEEACITEKEISNGKIKTNGKGEFEISFITVPDENISSNQNPVFNFKIHTDVTDINGETSSADKVVRVSYKSLMLTTDIPEKLEKHANGDFEIESENLNRDFIPASGNISIDKLHSPARIFRDREWKRPDRFTLSEKNMRRYSRMIFMTMR